MTVSTFNEEITVWVKEFDDDHEHLFTIEKVFTDLDIATEYAMAYHEGRKEWPGGYYELIFTKR